MYILSTFTMKSFNTYVIRLNIMKLIHKMLLHFFIYNIKFTSYEALVRTAVYKKSGLIICPTDLSTFFALAHLLFFTTGSCSWLHPFL